ncbi:MAG: hypothetical protein WAQ27_00365 [Candidatus Microsaccharimonas sp.]
MLRFSGSTKRQKGDTLIEVLFAVSVFSLIVVSSLSLMSQGLAASQRSLEITLARQQLDGQAEGLRIMHASYVEAYKSGITFDTTDPLTSPAEEYFKLINFVRTAGLTSASKFGGTDPCALTTNVSKKFIINPVSATIVTDGTTPNVFENSKTVPQLTYTSGNVVNRSQGVWVEGVRKAAAVNSAGYIDFHIRACWDSARTNSPMNVGTIVRLYEPRG